MSKINRIKELLERMTPDIVGHLRKEILQKERELIYEAQDGNRLDAIHKDMVINSIRDNRIKNHPENLNRLMLQFVSSAFSYSVLREELKRKYYHFFHENKYPILDDNMLLLSKIFHETNLENEANWHPNKLLEIAKGIQEQRNYDLRSKKPEPRITAILLTAPPVINAIFGDNIKQKYVEIEQMQNIPDAIDRANALWYFAENFHKYEGMKIKYVGTALVCDFLKESGFKNYAKIDVQMINAINSMIGEGCKKFSNFELFIATQWISQNIEMTPFKLDKILYVFGWMNGKNNR